MPDRHVLLLTGTPGVGKTTVISKVVAKLNRARLAGFYTEEIRVHGERRRRSPQLGDAADRGRPASDPHAAYRSPVAL